ncbi:GxxExxY protein [Microbacterium sp. KUDC0406]|uniref:GxxExxY protein n=1 Tax=Microbacterium sp. KUDC0406 TaxID=2909588 RepID=UPI001F333458|nr:GxxExxY protein [Microbacterium sp. KUDC0406]UJP09485.1 GxxExxY protein [Microbacterium sp. KUDC0406]
MLTYEQVEAIFRSLPQRFRALMALVDASAESGPETFMRLLLRSLGLPFETQVVLPGVGRVDFVVAGWLIIECDSREFHEGWDRQIADRARDIAAARMGYVTIRPLAADIFDSPSDVRAAVEQVVEVLGPLLGDRRAPQLRRSGSRLTGRTRGERHAAVISGVVAGRPA